jgi:hypothetical protein
MKVILSCALLMSLVACSTSAPPVYKLKGYSGPEAMDNQEVVQASRQCLFNKLRPNVNYLSVRTDQGKTLVPVSVTCEPF